MRERLRKDYTNWANVRRRFRERKGEIVRRSGMTQHGIVQNQKAYPDT